MQYKKIHIDNVVIEFHNNWLGEETVIVNGKMVSKKSSVWGTNHYFNVFENGHLNRYILTTKVNDGLQVVLDLTKNGRLIQRDVPVQFDTRAFKFRNKEKKKGMAALKEYELKKAVKHFKEALKQSPKDPEIHFHLACAYSVLEEGEVGFESLKNAVAYGLKDTEKILNHDMLAFIRIQDAFEDFLNSNFTQYDSTRISKENL